MAQHGTIVWTELNTREVEKAKAFYAASLGWTFSDVPIPEGTYTLAHNGGPYPVAGFFDINAAEFAGMPPHWFSYVEVDDLDARLATAVAAGATIVKPAFEVPGTGRIAIIKQPDGAVVGWMTSVPM
jgi:uncharacterized protein